MSQEVPVPNVRLAGIHSPSKFVPCIASLMVNPGAFHGARKEFLIAEKPAYAAGVIGGYAGDALALIQRRYFKRFPVDLPHEDEPSAENLAAVDDDAPDAEHQLPDRETVDEEAYALAEKALEERAKLVKFRKAQIKRWLAYQYMKDNDVDPKESGAQNPYRVLLHKLTGVGVTRPRAKKPVNLWRKAQKATIDEEVSHRVAAGGPGLGTNRKNLVALRDKVARDLFSNLSDEEKEEWVERTREENEAALERWKQDTEGPPSKEPADRQRCIQGLVRFAQPILDAICEATGWSATLIAGGPEPADGGRLNVVSVHSGTTSGDVKMNFGRADRLRFKKIWVPMYGQFLQKCYTLDECRARALPTEEGHLALSGLDLWNDDGATFDSISNQPSSVTNPQAVPSASLAIAPRTLPLSTPRALDQSPRRVVSQPAPSTPLSVPRTPAPSPPRTPAPSPPRTPALSPPRSAPHSPAPSPPHAPSRRSAPPPQCPAPSPPRSPGPHSPAPLPQRATPASLAQPVPGLTQRQIDTASARPSNRKGPGARGATLSTAAGSKATNTHRRDQAGARSAASSAIKAPAKRKRDGGGAADSDNRPSAAKRTRTQVAVASSPAPPPSRRLRASSRIATAATTAIPPSSRPKPRPKKVSTQPAAILQATEPDIRRRAPAPHATTLVSTTSAAGMTTAREYPNAPAWFTSAYSLLRDESLGAQWRELVEVWAAFETKQNYQHISRLKTSSRPFAVAEWIRRARSETWRPEIENITAYEEDMMEWWTSLQPAWRVSDGTVQLDVLDGDWESLRCPGTNGILGVLAGLFYWGWYVTEHAEDDVLWREITSDCHAALSRLLA